MRTFEYNGMVYHPGYIVPMFVVDYIKSDEAEQKQKEVKPT